MFPSLEFQKILTETLDRSQGKSRQKSNEFRAKLVLGALVKMTYLSDEKFDGGLMRAEVKKQGDVTIISIEGTLHIEETQPFREVCKKRFMGEKIVFNMSGAHFVGSTGLQSFMDAVCAMDGSGPHGLKLVGLKPEFRRLFGSVENARFQYFEDVRAAVGAFVQAPVSTVIPFPMPVVAKLIAD